MPGGIIILDSLGGLNAITKIFKTVKDRQKKRIRERDMKTEGMSEWCDVKRDMTGSCWLWSGERRPGADKCGPSLATGKVKERNSPLEPLEGNTALPIPWF